MVLMLHLICYYLKLNLLKFFSNYKILLLMLHSNYWSVFHIEFLDKLFTLLNFVIDVAFKLVIDKVDLADKLFKLLNIVVDALFELLIDNVKLVEMFLNLGKNWTLG